MAGCCAFGDKGSLGVLVCAERLDFLAVRKFFHTFGLGNGARRQYGATRSGVAYVARCGQTNV